MFTRPDSGQAGFPPALPARCYLPVPNAADRLPRLTAAKAWAEKRLLSPTIWWCRIRSAYEFSFVDPGHARSFARRFRLNPPTIVEPSHSHSHP